MNLTATEVPITAKARGRGEIIPENHHAQGIILCAKNRKMNGIQVQGKRGNAELEPGAAKVADGSKRALLSER